jgi:hypothetical protein
MDLASVERNGLWREAPNKVRACALWPVAFHRRKAGGDATWSGIGILPMPRHLRLQTRYQ